MVYFQKIQIIKKKPLCSNGKSISMNMCSVIANRFKLISESYILSLLYCISFGVYLNLKKQTVEQNFAMFWS